MTLQTATATATGTAGSAAPQRPALSDIPAIHPTANVRDSHLGAWTAVGARTTIAESDMGDYSYVVNDSSIIYSDIGKFCSIAAHTRINPGNHPLERVALHHFTYRSRSYELGPDDDREFFEWRRSHKVVIGNDVWIGHGAVVLPGVRIGNGAAIGAAAVVSKDVPDFAVAVGVPAKVLRYRFSEDLQERLLKLSWWNWDRDKLALALPDFRNLSIEDFLDKYSEESRA
jgi:phosphonate metabolism protein (transferase hexapeptide repeat family)